MNTSNLGAGPVNRNRRSSPCPSCAAPPPCSPRCRRSPRPRSSPAPRPPNPFSTAPCALHRTEAHHSEGVDSWNPAYSRPTGAPDAVLVFLSFPDATPRTTPAQLTADHFPATSRFYAQASYGRFTLRPHPLKRWLRMPRPSTSYAMRRDWSAEDRAAYLRDAFAVADKEVDFSRYPVVYLVADPDAPGVDSDATKVVNLETPLRVDGTDVQRVVTVFGAPSAGPARPRPRDRPCLRPARPLPPAGRRQGRLGHLCRRLGPDGQPVRPGPGPVRLAQVAARLAGPAPGGVRARGHTDPAHPGGPSRPGRGSRCRVRAAPPPSASAAASSWPSCAPARTAPSPSRRAARPATTGCPAGRGSWSTGCAAAPRRATARSRSWTPTRAPSPAGRTRSTRPSPTRPVSLGESFTVPGEGVKVEAEGRTASGAWTVKITPGMRE